ncbi:MAG: DUF1616 domain-containing protein [Nanoarchaeota archaeon]
MKTHHKWIAFIGLFIVILAVISLNVAFFTKLGYLESFRIFFGSVYVLFLPGFILSYLFFPETKEFDEDRKKLKSEESDNGKNIDWIERVALSFALSIAVVPLAVFYLNLVGVRINFLNSFLIILGIITISSVILWFRVRKK